MFSYVKPLAGASMPSVAAIKAPVPVVQPSPLPQGSPLANAARKTQEPLLASPMSSSARCCLTPASKALIDKPGGKTPDNFSAKKRKLSELAQAHANPRAKSRRSDGAEHSITQRALKTKSLGNLQELYSCESDEHGRAMARAVGDLFNGIPIQTVSLNELARQDEHHKADFKLFQDAIKDLSGEVVNSASDALGFLTGNDVILNTSTKNFLLTVVSFPNGFKLRFVSVSGNVRPELGDQGTGTLSVLGKGGASTQLNCQLIPRLKWGVKKPAVMAHADIIHRELQAGENKIYYLGYRDLGVVNGNRPKEWRGVPKIGTHARDGGIHDRARDTEYMALSGLSMLLRENPGLSGLPMDIRMFSKNKMCSGCEIAATYAGLQKEFIGLKSFRIYGGSSNY